MTGVEGGRPIPAPLRQAPWAYLAQLVVLAVAYYAVGRLGLAAGALKGNVTPVWPPTGLSIAALLVFGRRLWPGVAAGALLVNGLSAVPTLTACGMSIGNTLEAVAGAYLVSRFARRPTDLDRVRDVLVFSILGAGLATMVSATIGVTSLRLGGVIPPAAIWPTLRVWWVGDALGALVVTPVVLALVPRRRPTIDRRGTAELVLLLGATYAVGAFAFSGRFDFAYVVFPPVIWAALRWRLQGASTATLIASVIAVLGTRSGHGAFARGDATHSLWTLDAFLGAVALTGLMISAVVAERDRTSAHNAELSHDLQRNVEELDAAQDELRSARALVESETRYRALLDHLPGTGVLLLDRALRVVADGGSLFSQRGFSRDMMIGREVAHIVAPEEAAFLVPRYQAVLDGHPSGTFEYSPLSGGHYLVDAVPLEYGSGTIEHVLVTVRDVTALETALQDRGRAESGYQAAFEDAPVGMAQVTLSGRLERVNPALCALVGHTRAELVGRSLVSLVHPADTNAAAQELGRLTAGTTTTYRTEQRYLDARGGQLWMEVCAVAVPGTDGEVDHLLMHFLDVTARKTFEADLRGMANHDPLTGLLNRRGFETELDRHAARISHTEASGALLLLDLDRFKQINDSLGHHAGDQLIAAMAKVLQRAVRETDVVARLGGDEFAVLLPGDGRVEAELAADRILHAVRQEVTVLAGAHPRCITASIGIALFDQHHLSAADVLIDADISMYDAKDAGRDCFVTCSPLGHERGTSTANIGWVERIATALRDDHFVLHAQPILGLAESVVRRYELLIRMLDEDGSLIAPAAFLPIAERSGLIVQIDRWVTGQAIQLLTDPALPSDVVLEVNLSARSVGDPEMLSYLEDRLVSTGADPTRLVFEITETAALANMEGARFFVERLAEIGCRFAIDDFGAGFGSFYYLKHLPFDYIKIDGEFVTNCTNNATDQLVIASVVNIARSLGKATIAEFVEDSEALAFLRAEGVDFAQGNWIGRPAPIEEILLPEPSSAGSDTAA
ncbi:hypothetical protein Back2_08810 [Nocardioides baekrokdamisoli]|uniref:GGDEF domain-containing protein n=1 Tax=Nocardioides baekrokdamisoli TaxID=1804624 RepID=A0A3G9IZI0_9ACTN|nr:EAL domain-containing protein [Nocardioides baekrokdamisoli]BBH16594.1 hypothetical protein Back2_08810 [Nocardioides baekrokdamisoli]